MGDDGTKKIQTRVNRIAGQVAGIRRMVEEGHYCVEVLHQIAAVRSALDPSGSRSSPDTSSLAFSAMAGGISTQAQRP